VVIASVGLLACRSRPQPAPHAIALAALESDGDCAWVRYETAPPTCELLTSSAPACSDDITLVWAPGFERVLMWWGGEQGPTQEVQFAEASAGATPLPSPPRGGVRDLGYREGQPIALTVDRSLRREQHHGTLVIRFAGERYYVDDDHQTMGPVALAHSYQLGPAGWRRLDTALTTDDDEAELALDDPASLPEAGAVLPNMPRQAREPGAQESRRLSRWRPSRAGGWQISDNEAGAVAWWLEGSEPTTPILHRSSDRWREVPVRLPRGAGVSLLVDGPLLVIASAGHDTVIFDTRSRTTVSRLPPSLVLTRWPGSAPGAGGSATMIDSGG